MKGSRPISLLLIFLLLCQGIIPVGAAGVQTQDVVILGSISLDKEIDAIALAPNTGIAYGINSEGKTLYIFDLKTYTVKKKIRFERKPISIAVHPSTNIAYITARDDKNKGTLYMVDSEGNISSKDIPQDPQGIALNPGKNEAVIAIEKDKQLLILSLDNLAPIGTINLTHRPNLISLDTDSNKAVVVAGEAQGEGKQNRVLIVDLNSGATLFDISLKQEITALSVDMEKDIAIALSEEKVTIIDINNGRILSTFRVDDAEAIDINQSTHTAVITTENGLVLLDLNSLSTVNYSLDAEFESIAVDKYRNRALLGGDDRVIEIQLLNPVPVITSLIPKSARAGESGFALKVEGERFITSSSVKFNNSSIDTTFKDSTELEASVTANLLANPGTVPVTVTNPQPSGGTSAPYPFTIKYPIPVLQSLSPTSIPARSPDFTLKIYGSNFMQGYVANFNGQNLQTSYLSSGELNATVPSMLVQTKGTYLVVVTTPDGQNSNFINFSVTDPYPVITSFAPTQGRTGTLVTITGDNFNNIPTSVYFNGRQAIIQSLTNTEIKAVVPISATTGPVTVTNSIGSTQSSQPFTVLLRQDFVLDIKPQSVSIPVNGSASTVVSLQSTGIETFSGLVKLSASVSESGGITTTFNPEYISANNASLLTVKLTSPLSEPVVLNITGVSNIEGVDITRSASFTINPIPPGATTITGRIVTSKHAKPIKGVTLTISNKTSITDDAGNFFFVDVPVGEQVLIIDGHTANTATTTYPSAIPVPVTIIGGVDNKLPYFIYLHEVNTKHFTPINPARDTIVTDPALPNFEMKIPQGVDIIGWDGLPNEKVSVTPVPVDRLPIKPLPDGVYASEIYMYYFGKPGGGIPSQPIPVKMPNTFQANPGDRAVLWYYDESSTPDPNSNQWKPFGMGTVSDNGKNIIPDPGVGIPKFCCGASFQALANPPASPQPAPPGGPCPIADPVDPYNGMFIYSKSDIGYPTPSLVNVTRLYNSGNTEIGPFGRGTNSNYNYFLQSSGSALIYITPEGGRYILSQEADGSYINIAYPFLRGAKAYLNADGTRTMRFKNGRTYTFDSNSRLIEERDPNDNWVIISRDTFGFITGLIDSFGRRLYVTNINKPVGLGNYTLISSITDAIGREVKYTYDAGAWLTSVKMPDGSETKYSYDGNGRLFSITNPRNIVEVINEYDSYGRVAKQSHADGGDYLLYYFSPSTPVRVQNPPTPLESSCTPEFVREGESPASTSCGVIYVNVPTSVPVPQGSTANYIVTQTVVIKPNKASETYRFNGQGYALSETDGIGGQVSYEHETSTNLLLSVTDQLGRKTAYAYDSNGNATSIKDPAGNETIFEYDPAFNKPTKKKDALLNETSMAYDAKGNLIQIKTPKNETTDITYNASGQPVTVIDALNNSAMAFEYDNYGNMKKVMDVLANAKWLEYDIAGRLTVAKDPKGNTTLYSYDALNRLKEITDALNGKTRFTYDENGNLLTVTDAKTQTITYAYNPRDKVSSMTDQLLKSEIYSYDKSDNLIAVKDRKNQVTNYTYDMNNRLVKADYADGSFTTYDYDAVGRLTYIDDSVSGPIEWVYANTGCSGGCGSWFADRIIQEITPLGNISYEYDALGRRKKMTVAGQEPVDYIYDVNSRLTDINTLISGVPKGFNIQYDALGRRTALVLPNGITTNYAYDSASNLLEIKHLDPLSFILEKMSYSYDKNSNRTDMNRLSAPVKLPIQASNINYNQANQMLSFKDKNITYDDNGNMTSIANGCGTTNYTWDVRNRLVGMNGFNTDCSPLTASFKYDALGRRIEKTINGKTIAYLYDGLDIIQEMESGMATVNYIRTLNIDEPLARIKSDGTVRYYQRDALGSVISLTTENGQLATSYAYDPFGNVTISGEASDNPFQYTGRENDGTGLYYYRARYYNQELQRFISEDPIGLVGGINKFAYVGNNPVNRKDPSGKILICGDPEYFGACVPSGEPASDLPDPCGDKKPSNLGKIAGGIAMMVGGLGTTYLGYWLMGLGATEMGASATTGPGLALGIAGGLHTMGVGGSMMVTGGYATLKGYDMLSDGLGW